MKMGKPMRKLACLLVVFLANAAAGTAFLTGARVGAQTELGKYLVMLGGCNDCHTPGYFLGKPDFSRTLGGSEVGFEIPGLGVFHGRNLTPDKETGLGDWTPEEVVAAITKGQRPDGRELAPIMPWRSFPVLTKDDALAIAAYLKSLPPMKNKVPGPFGAERDADVLRDEGYAA